MDRGKPPGDADDDAGKTGRIATNVHHHGRHASRILYHRRFTPAVRRSARALTRSGTLEPTDPRSRHLYQRSHMLLSLSLAGVSRFDRSALGGTTTAAFVGVNAVFGGVVAVVVVVVSSSL